MFGFIRANINDLTDEEKVRYRAVYCGLCKNIKKRYGITACFSLSYDLTFLILLFSSLYEPDENSKIENCIVHPFKKSVKTGNEFTDYAADLTVALAYHNCIDDWKDDKDIIKKAYSLLLKSDYKKAKKSLIRQCQSIEKELSLLSEIEKENDGRSDEAANSFGRLLGDLFVIREDKWTKELYSIGFNLGRFIYMADAVIDYDEDIKKGNYNPLSGLDIRPDEMRDVLTQILGRVSESFERLPLENDLNLLRNIIYSGVWINLNESRTKSQED